MRIRYWRAHGLRSPVGGGDRLESRSVVPNKALGMVVNGFFTEAQREAVRTRKKTNENETKRNETKEKNETNETKRKKKKKTHGRWFSPAAY